jgi:hypothetical protein
VKVLQQPVFQLTVIYRQSRLKEGKIEHHNLCIWATEVFVLNSRNLCKIGCLSICGCEGCPSIFTCLNISISIGIKRLDFFFFFGN